MKLSREHVVGLFFFGLLALLGFFTMYLSDIHLGGGEYLVVQFPHVKGLKRGDNVNVLGLKSGKVKSIELGGDLGGVQVTLWLKEKLHLTEDSDIRVNDSSLLGGKQVDIDPGTPDKPEKDKSRPIQGISTVELAKALPELVDENRAALRETMNNLREITAQVQRGQGPLGTFVKNERMAENLSRIVENLDRISSDLASGRGLVGMLLQDERARSNAAGAIENLHALSVELRAGKGVAGRLFTDDRLAQDLSDTVANLSAVSGRLARGEGTLGKLIVDDRAFEDLAAAATNLKAITDKINQGEGSLAMLVNDGRLYDDVSETAKSIREIVADVQAGRGTIGKMLREEKLYDEITRTIQQFRSAVQEARESAPITTFTAALFAIF